MSNQLRFLSTLAKLKGAVIFVPVQAVYGEVTSGQLVPVTLDCKPFSYRELSITVRRQRMLSSATNIFLDFAIDKIATWQSLDPTALEDARGHWTAA